MTDGHWKVVYRYKTRRQAVQDRTGRGGWHRAWQGEEGNVSQELSFTANHMPSLSTKNFQSGKENDRKNKNSVTVLSKKSPRVLVRQRRESTFLWDWMGKAHPRWPDHPNKEAKTMGNMRAPPPPSEQKTNIQEWRKWNSNWHWVSLASCSGGRASWKWSGPRGGLENLTHRKLPRTPFRLAYFNKGVETVCCCCFVLAQGTK